MRIVAGKYGGRALSTPKNRDIRPTSDKIRGAVMNALHSRGALEGAQVLDLFCGTGALGLEALSRGAAHCVFVDKSRESLALAQKNAENLGALTECTFLIKEAVRLPEPKEQASLVFIDPPYAQAAQLLTKTLAQLQPFLAADAALMLEMDKRTDFMLPAPYVLLNEKNYGDTKILLANYAGIKESEEPRA